MNYINMNHQMVKVTLGFDAFTRNLEAALGRLNPTLLQKVGTEPAVVEAYLKQIAGEADLILFDIRDHGQMLAIVGAPQKAKQYEIGNPLIAIQMTQHDIRSALYAPLRVLVYEAADRSVYVEYDLPSSLFGQFGNAEVTKVAESLDLKLVDLIAKVDYRLLATPTVTQSMREGMKSPHITIASAAFDQSVDSTA